MGGHDWTRRDVGGFLLAGLAVAALPLPAVAQSRRGLLDGLGLKKLLAGASDGALTKLAEPGAFYRDTAIRILLPGASGKLARKLLGAGDKLGLTTNLTRSLNDAAGLAANEAKPVFRSAIDGLRISDVPGIALNKQGGTDYLRTTAGGELQGKVRPLIGSALSQVGAYDQLARLGQTSSLLGTLGLTPDGLTDSVAEQAMKGIFRYMGSEEAKLKSDPTRILGKIL